MVLCSSNYVPDINGNTNEVRSGRMRHWKKRCWPFGGRWEDVWVSLYQDSVFIWRRKEGSRPKGGTKISEAPEMFDAGPHVVQIPGKQPKWPDRNSLDQAIAFGRRDGSKVQYLITESETDLVIWLQAITTTLPALISQAPGASPQQQSSSPPNRAQPSNPQHQPQQQFTSNRQPKPAQAQQQPLQQQKPYQQQQPPSYPQQHPHPYPQQQPGYGGGRGNTTVIVEPGGGRTRDSGAGLGTGLLAGGLIGYGLGGGFRGLGGGWGGGGLGGGGSNSSDQIVNETNTTNVTNYYGDQDPTNQEEEVSKEKVREGRRRVKKVKRKVRKEKLSEHNKHRRFSTSCASERRRSSGLSLEVEKIATGRKLTHFQAMAMLRKALVTSFISSSRNQVVMKSTENRRLSQINHDDIQKVSKNFQGILLKTETETEDEDEEEEKKPEEIVQSAEAGDKDDQEDSVKQQSKENQEGVVKLVKKVAGKKSCWKIVEKQFIQGKDVSNSDAWKMILLSDLFPKGTVAFDNLVEDNSTSSSEEKDKEVCDYDEDGSEYDDNEDDDNDDVDVLSEKEEGKGYLSV